MSSRLTGTLVTHPTVLTAEIPRLALEAEPYPLDRSPVVAYFTRLSRGGRDSMRWNLARAVRLLTHNRCQDPMAIAWHLLTYTHLLALRATLIERGCAPQTCARTLDGVRGVLKECWKLGWMRHEAYQLAVDIPRVKGSRLPCGRWVEPAEMAQLFRQCAADPRRAIGARDAGMIAVLYGCGLRRMEVVNLDLIDYDAAAGTIHVRKGKGNKNRIVYVHPDVAQALQAWLTVRGHRYGPLFPCLARGGHVRGKRLSYRVVGILLARRLQRAGLPHFSPHDLRRSFVNGLLDAGADLSTVQLLAGHTNITTTALYDRRPEHRKRAAVNLLTVPYSPPI
jgi:site-specific recombinase XerD